MNHEIMTIDEVAEYLRVSERTVYDWAQKGQLPCGKLGTTWRFKRSDIEAWVDQQLGTPPLPLFEGEGLLSRIISPNRVVFLEDCGKENALKTLCAALATSPLVQKEDELSDAIFKREELMSTGIGFGIGVPHARLSSVSDVVMSLGIARVPIADYTSLDDVPVQVVCMVAAGSTQHPEYIRTLSVLSSRLKGETVRKALISAPDAMAALTLFTAEMA